ATSLHPAPALYNPISSMPSPSSRHLPLILSLLAALTIGIAILLRREAPEPSTAAPADTGTEAPARTSQSGPDTPGREPRGKTTVGPADKSAPSPGLSAL